MTKPNVESEAPPGVVGEKYAGRRRRVADVLRNRPGARHRRGGPGDVRDVPRSHPQNAKPVLTTLRAPCLFLHLIKQYLREPCLFLFRCKIKYKTCVRFESGDESPHSKDASRRRSKPKGDALQRRFASREQA